MADYDEAEFMGEIEFELFWEDINTQDEENKKSETWWSIEKTIFKNIEKSKVRSKK